jgi:hypothetical protein
VAVMNVEMPMMRGDFIRHGILPIWIKCIREGVGICIRTPTFLFNLGLSNIQRIFSTSTKLVKSMGYKCHSQLRKKKRKRRMKEEIQ